MTALPPLGLTPANDGGRARVNEILRELPYEDYLTRNHWANVTEATLERYGHCCGICGRMAVTVAHISRANLGAELPEDTIACCRRDAALDPSILRHFVIC